MAVSVSGFHRTYASKSRGWSRLRAGALVGLALLLAGCSGIASKERAYGLNRAVKTYSHAVRWNKLSEASAYARPREGEIEPYDPAAYEGLNVISNDLSVGALNEDLNEASVDMTFGYHWDDSAVIRSMSQPTQWYWDEEDERWYMDGGLPVFPGR